MSPVPVVLHLLLGGEPPLAARALEPAGRRAEHLELATAARGDALRAVAGQRGVLGLAVVSPRRQVPAGEASDGRHEDGVESKRISQAQIRPLLLVLSPSPSRGLLRDCTTSPINRLQL